MPEAPLISIIECDSPNKKSSSIHNRNYLIYIATRDGVDLTNVDLERELQQMEYENATQAEHADNQQYLKYIEERPGSQGLFGNIDVSNPEKLGNRLADLTSEGHLIYRGIVSLREDDAIRLGFDRKAPWVDYMNIVVPDIAREFNIPIDKLEWTAAFHIKNGHPHCHYMFWSKEKQVDSPFIHVSKQTRCREMLSKEMFHLEREEAVINKTLARDLTISVTKEMVKDEISLLLHEPEKLTGFFKTEDVKKLSTELLDFTTKLPGSGRLAYKLLPPETKEALNELIDKFLETQPLNVDYYRYLHAVDDISQSYSASARHSEVTRERADEDLRKRMGNVILKACKTLLLEKDRLSGFELNYNQESLFPEQFATTQDEPDYHPDILPTADPDEKADLFTSDSASISPAFEPEGEASTLLSKVPILFSDDDYKMDWNKEYREAMSILYDDKIENKETAINILTAEATKNNVIATHQLAQIYQRGIYVEADTAKADLLFKEAFKGFNSVLTMYEYRKMKSYINYRIGKYYENGWGVDQDYQQAIYSYRQAGSNKYAQYSLGSLYLHGKGIDITAENKNEWITEEAELFKHSADQNFPYAAYAYARLCESETQVLSVPDNIIHDYYAAALRGFEQSVKNQPDDNLYYRLGTMYYAGKGTTASQERAYEYFIKSAEYNNPNAQYALGKTYADPDTPYYDPQKAEEMFQLSSAQDNHYATYALGKLYATSGELYDPEKAEYSFKEILQELPAQAHYALGKLYATPDSPLLDFPLAVQYFKLAAEHGNDYALYSLAKIYLDQESELYDFNQGYTYLQEATLAGNTHAAYALGKIYATPGELYDPEKAEYNFKKALQELPEQTHYALGKLYATLGSPLYNIALAVQHFTEAAEYGNDYAQYSLAKIYLDQESELYNFNQGFTYLQEAISKGNIYAAFALGKLYASPGELYDPQKAEHSFRELLQELPEQAHHALGKLYATPDSPLLNITLAIHHLREAAEYGNNYAQYSLAKIYLDQESGLYDFNQGITYLQEATIAGNAHAAYTLGKLYASPEALNDSIKAEQLFKSALATLPEQCHYALGKLYASTESPLLNMPLAARHFTEAAEYGNMYAQYSLSKIYHDKESGLYDFNQGFTYLYESASSGNAYAMTQLGRLYLWGHEELKANVDLGKEWLHKALENGDANAQNVLNMYENYKRDIAVSVSFSLCRSLLRVCSSRRKPENLQEVVSKVRSREAIIDAQKKTERTR